MHDIPYFRKLFKLRVLCGAEMWHTYKSHLSDQASRETVVVQLVYRKLNQLSRIDTFTDTNVMDYCSV